MSIKGLRWMSDAACKGKGEMFFPEVPTGNLNAARKICAECPVRVECLEYGLELVDPSKIQDTITRGIWGGLSTDELTDMARGSFTGEMSDHECEHPRCTAKTRMALRGGKPARYCSQRCLKAASAANRYLRNKAKEDGMNP